MNLKECTLTSINGILVGHETNEKDKTGCTVVLCPPHTTCAISKVGGGFGTRETDSLGPGRLVECVDALVFSGGSAFGLGACDGVIQFLRDKGRGIKTFGGPIPIVPGAIIYDLLVGENFSFPDAKMGFRASKNARALDVESGSIGAGAGATVNKFRGLTHAQKSGIGNAGAYISSQLSVSVMLVVNAFGQIVDEHAHCQNNELFQSESSLILSENLEHCIAQNTVVGVVATNARLSKDELTIVASMAQSGLSRVIVPSHTPFDGDTIFAISTGTKPFDVVSIGTLAQKLVGVAVRDAVCAAHISGDEK